MAKRKNPRKSTLSNEDREKIHATFFENGINFSQWARERGFSIKILFAVLYEPRKCTHGESFKIAKALKEYVAAEAGNF